ncbi:hypothetical protein F441_12319 [Phytophthora nicotianae CJ01A1]|uniref:BED-type domain-containing protein n=1 Tax=Phytophthora nicotianae CJ01A1 TaxID=1317063 RepID=W2WRW5_PHYNI|nr:hypothetical protein F441_12319 [Phytophthora nicotianae CJ01A1]
MAEVPLTSPPPASAISNKQVVLFYFSPCVDASGEPTDYFKCKVCATTHKQALGRGVTNLCQHIRLKHPQL